MANISSYNQLSSWNEDDDLLFVQQPDAPKKAHPSQMKEYILEGLDVSSVGGTGKYISEISEADGKINATAETMDDVPTENSNAPVKSGGIKTAIDDSVSLKTATGNPITLTDAANANAEELSMTIEPIQDLHGYSKPWPAGGGKNKAHIDSTKIFNTNKNPSDPISGIADGMLILGAAANGYIRTATLGTYTINNQNSITAEIVDNASFGVGIVVEVDDTKTYTLNLVKTGGDVEIGWLNNDGSSLSSAGQQTLPVNLTPPTGAKYLIIVCLPGLVENTFSNIQLEVGTSATTFEPWENICPISGLTSGEVETTDGTDTNTATITLGQTVYGGSVNFKTGEVTVTHKLTTVGAISWLTQGGNYANFYSDSLMSEIKKSNTENVIKSNIYIGVTNSQPSGPTPYATYANSDGQIKVNDRRYSTVNEWLADCASVQLCYELATPTTLTLTPAELELLKGNNTITANGAEINLSYYPDNAIGVLAGRVDDIQEQIAGLIANTLIGIDISAYNSSSNQYTAPTDGYVRMELRNANQYFYLNINNATLLGGEGHQVANANDYMTVFVRKGMKLYYNGTVQTAMFYSLT